METADVESLPVIPALQLKGGNFFDAEANQLIEDDAVAIIFASESLREAFVDLLYAHVGYFRMFLWLIGNNLISASTGPDKAGILFDPEYLIIATSAAYLFIKSRIPGVSLPQRAEWWRANS
jgi:hypothetical protein